MKTPHQSACSINRFTSCQNSFLKICDHRLKTPVIIDDEMDYSRINRICISSIDLVLIINRMDELDK